MNELALTLALLVVATGSDSFQTREEASTILAQYGALAETHLYYGWSYSNDPEIAIRCSHALCKLTDSALLHSLWSDQFPWIDSLPDEYSNRTAIIKMYTERSSLPSMQPSWFGHRDATRLMAVDMIRNHVPREQIIELLKNMAEVEKEKIALNSRRGVR